MCRPSQNRDAASQFYSLWRHFLPLKHCSELGPEPWFLSYNRADAWAAMEEMDAPCHIIMHFRCETLVRLIALEVVVQRNLPLHPRGWQLWRSIPAVDIAWMELHLRPSPASLPLTPRPSEGREPAEAAAKPTTVTHAFASIELPTALPTEAALPEPARPTAEGPTTENTAEEIEATNEGPTDAVDGWRGDSCASSHSSSRPWGDSRDRSRSRSRQ
jgi:hypothetical protein